MKPPFTKPLVLLALVVGLQSADNGTVGALVVPLTRSLHIDNTQVGLLVTVSTGIGALIGVLSTGRIADWLMTRGHVSARMVVGGAAFLAAAVFTLPALLTHSPALAIVFGFLAAIAFGGVNPPLNAARLDVVHSRVWGTAEAVRTTLVSISTGLAPLVFGLVSTNLGGSTADVSGAGEGQGGLAGAAGIAPSAAIGLDRTFLITLVSLVIAAALILCVARRTYPRDVAAAMACECAAGDARDGSDGVDRPVSSQRSTVLSRSAAG
jgi:MFS family permease